MGTHQGFGFGDVLGYAPETLARFGATGADSPLGNFAAAAALAAARADVAVIGASSLRADLARGALDEEALERSFPFDDPVLRVLVTGSGLLAAFERASTTAAERDCRAPLHVAGALVRLVCPCESAPCAAVFVEKTDVCCETDADCTVVSGACDAAKFPEGVSAGEGRCFLPVSTLRSYVVATTAYLADGNGGYFESEASRGPQWQFVGLEIDWSSLERLYAEVGLATRLPAAAWRTSVPMYAGNEQAGYATSGGWSPLLKKYIALAHLRGDWGAPGTRLEIEITVEHRRKRAAAQVVKKPFFDPERKRA